MKIPEVDLKAVGYFDSRDEMERTAMREKISPIVSQMTALIAEAFQVGFDAGMECGRYTDYSTKEG